MSVLQSLPYQAPGVIGSVLGLVGLVSVHCDCVRVESLMYKLINERRKITIKTDEK